MQNEEIYHLIGKKLANDISDEELSQLDAFLKADESNKALYDDLERRWLDSAMYKSAYEPNLDDSWSKFKETVDQGEAKQINMFPVMYRVAALVVFTLGLGYFFLNQEETQSLSYSTAEGEQIEITLPDQSKVWLNESSELLVSADFNLESREVNLSGEAFFDIQRDETRPFKIASATTQVEVLGTSFNVQAYPEQANVTVQVSTGTVAFGELGQIENRLVLKKGMGGVFNKEDKSMESYSMEGSNHLSWKTKNLVFKDASLDQVVRDLSEYFNVTIELSNDDLSTCKFTSSFEDPTLEEVLDIISITLDITFKKSGSKYILDGRGCTN